MRAPLTHTDGQRPAPRMLLSPPRRERLRRRSYRALRGAAHVARFLPRAEHGVARETLYEMLGV